MTYCPQTYAGIMGLAVVALIMGCQVTDGGTRPRTHVHQTSADAHRPTAGEAALLAIFQPLVPPEAVVEIRAAAPSSFTGEPILYGRITFDAGATLPYFGSLDRYDEPIAAIPREHRIIDMLTRTSVQERLTWWNPDEHEIVQVGEFRALGPRFGDAYRGSWATVAISQPIETDSALRYMYVCVEMNLSEYADINYAWRQVLPPSVADWRTDPSRPLHPLGDRLEAQLEESRSAKHFPTAVYASDRDRKDMLSILGPLVPKDAVVEVRSEAPFTFMGEPTLFGKITFQAEAGIPYFSSTGRGDPSALPVSAKHFIVDTLRRDALGKRIEWWDPDEHEMIQVGDFNIHGPRLGEEYRVWRIDTAVSELVGPEKNLRHMYVYFQPRRDHFEDMFARWKDLEPQLMGVMEQEMQWMKEFHPPQPVDHTDQDAGTR